MYSDTYFKSVKRVSQRFSFCFSVKRLHSKEYGSISFVSQEVLSLKVFNCMTTLKTFRVGGYLKN